MNPLRTAMPSMVAHEGEWDGTYRHIATDGSLLDEHRTQTSCIFPETGEDHYIQHSRLSWADGRREEYRFGGRLRDGLLRDARRRADATAGAPRRARRLLYRDDQPRARRPDPRPHLAMVPRR